MAFGFLLGTQTVSVFLLGASSRARSPLESVAPVLSKLEFNLPVYPYRTGEVCLAVVVWCLGCACVGATHTRQDGAAGLGILSRSSLLVNFHLATSLSQCEGCASGLFGAHFVAAVFVSIPKVKHFFLVRL